MFLEAFFKFLPWPFNTESNNKPKKRKRNNNLETMDNEIFSTKKKIKDNLISNNLSPSPSTITTTTTTSTNPNVITNSSSSFSTNIPNNKKSIKSTTKKKHTKRKSTVDRMINLTQQQELTSTIFTNKEEIKEEENKIPTWKSLIEKPLYQEEEEFKIKPHQSYYSTHSETEIEKQQPINKLEDKVITNGNKIRYYHNIFKEKPIIGKNNFERAHLRINLFKESRNQSFSLIDYNYGDEMDKLRRSLQSLITLREKSKEYKISRNILEKYTIDKVASRVITKITESLTSELVLELFKEKLPNKIYEEIVKETIEETIKLEKEFFFLSKIDLDKISKVLYGNKLQEVLVTKYNVDMTRDKLLCLKDGEWLNDEVINFYLNMIKDRNDRNTKLPKCHLFTTFFYSTLMRNNRYGYSNVKRWTRKIDLFEFHKIIIPIHLGVHWTLAIINLRDERFEYYDSMGGKATGTQILKDLERYIQDESLDKKNVALDTSHWKHYIPGPRHVPQQLNSWDCGVFTCKFANFLSQDLPLSFSQDDMPYFRKRMVLEIAYCHQIL
ncbi:hypothetical protein ABK040_002910 [Willaertia magna]